MEKNFRVFLLTFLFAVLFCLIPVNNASAGSTLSKPAMAFKIKKNSMLVSQKKTILKKAMSMPLASSADSCITGSFYWDNAYIEPTTAYVSSTNAVLYYINLYNVAVGDVITWLFATSVIDPKTYMPTGAFNPRNNASATLTRVDQQTWQYAEGINVYNYSVSSCNLSSFGVGPYIKGALITASPGPEQIMISYNGQLLTTGTFNLVDDLAPTINFSSPTAGAALMGTTSTTATLSDNLAVTKAELYADNLTTGQSYLVNTFTYNPPLSLYIVNNISFNYFWNTTQYPDGNYNLRIVAHDPYDNKGTGIVGVIIANNPVTPPGSVSQKNMILTPDPVNIATGEAYFSSTDFSLGARGSKLALFRKYRSLSTFSGMFGYGWRTDFDVNLTLDNSGNVTVYDGEGTAVYFTNNSGTYMPSASNYSNIIKNADGTFTLKDKNGISTHYDINGRLSSRTDRNGNVLAFVYSPSIFEGTYIQDASGRQIKLFFDSNNHIISAQDPAGKTFQYGYDVNGNLVSATDPTGAVTNYNYDSNHKIIEFTNANGHNTYYQYDAQGRVTMNWQDNNVNKVTLNYQPNNTTIVTDSLGNNNIFVFNSAGLLLSHTDPLGSVTQQTWDPFINRTSQTDARNNVTNFQYDIKGNLVQIKDPFGNQTNMTYTPNFNLISSKIDSLGNVTNFTYDNNGNLLAITDALGNNRSFIYDQYGSVITATDSHGNTTNLTYDAFSHIIQKKDALGYNTLFTYQ